MTSKKKEKHEPLIKKQTPKKNISTKLLVKRALKNGPKWKPSKGYKYLEDLEPGTSFISECGSKGVLLESLESGSTVMIIHSPCVKDESDNNYYLGKQRWASKTQVKKEK